MAIVATHSDRHFVTKSTYALHANITTPDQHIPITCTSHGVAAMADRATRLRAATARLADVPINHIHLPDPNRADRSVALPTLELEPDAEQIANLLRPPLLVADEGHPEHYLIVGNEPTFRRQLHLAGTNATRPQTVTAVILAGPDAPVAAIARSIEKYLIPLAFGELSVRKAAAARRSLRAARVTPPQRLSTRAAARRLVKQPAPSDDA